MAIHTASFSIETHGKGTYELTRQVESIVQKSGFSEGLVNVFVRHTSASLVIMENADPSARRDLEEFFDRLVPENTPWFQHTYEGPDDMPSHIRMALTRTSETFPIQNGRSAFGTWQGLFLFEHRSQRHIRQIVVTIIA